MQENILLLSTDWNLFKGYFKEDKYYLFNISDGSIINLNRVSYDILACFDGNKTLNQVIETLQKEYNVEESVLADDIKELVKKCMSKNVLIAKN